jgi:IS30 family transposase
MTMRADLCSIRSIAKRLCRSVSTISRELKRTSGSGVYDANLAMLQSMPVCWSCPHAARRPRNSL